MVGSPLPQSTETSPGTGVPLHVAIIMDGNGRWAKARGLPRAAGHKQGVECVRGTVKSAVRQGVRYLTLFGFSSENWKRPTSEITDLMGLLRLYLRNEVKFLHKNDVRLRVIGDRDRLSADIRNLIEKAEEDTRNNTTLDLVLALSYGGRAELVAAARALATDAKAGRIDPDAIDEDAFEARLFTADVPDPDLLIRTSGEQRISNFLLWQLAYAEFHFTDILWPDFDDQAFDDAVQAFGQRERRFGAVRG